MGMLTRMETAGYVRQRGSTANVGTGQIDEVGDCEDDCTNGDLPPAPPTESAVTQYRKFVSTALPSRKRTKCMWFWRTERPVGGIPISGPSWVPLMVKRPATTSPSATNSSIVKRRSGKAVRSMVANPLIDSGP